MFILRRISDDAATHGEWTCYTLGNDESDHDLFNLILALCGQLRLSELFGLSRLVVGSPSWAFGGAVPLWSYPWAIFTVHRMFVCTGR